MTLDERIEIGRNAHLRGFNCAQSAALAYADLINMDEYAIKAATVSFGGGIGGTGETCGALSGIFFVLGCLYYKEENGKGNKLEIYKRVQELTATFKVINNSTICRELKDRMRNGGTIHTCGQLIDDAITILFSYIEKNPY